MLSDARVPPVPKGRTTHQEKTQNVQPSYVPKALEHKV